MSNNFSIKSILSENINITPKDINKNISQSLLTILKNKIGNKCIKDGYVIKDSIQIIKFSAGEIIAEHFTGDVRFKVLYTATLYNPAENSEIECTIVNKNKMGLLGEAGEGDVKPISILLSKQHHYTKDFFKNVNIGDTRRVKVLGKKFELYETQIFVIGELLNDNLSGGNIKNENICSNIKSKDDIQIWITLYLNNNLHTNTLGIDTDKFRQFNEIIQNVEQNDNWENLSDPEKTYIILQKCKNIKNNNNLDDDITSYKHIKSGSLLDLKSNNDKGNNIAHIENQSTGNVTSFIDSDNELIDSDNELIDSGSESDGSDDLKLSRNIINI